MDFQETLKELLNKLQIFNEIQAAFYQETRKREEEEEGIQESQKKI